MREIYQIYNNHNWFSQTPFTCKVNYTNVQMLTHITLTDFSYESRLQLDQHLPQTAAVMEIQELGKEPK